MATIEDEGALAGREEEVSGDPPCCPLLSCHEALFALEEDRQYLESKHEHQGCQDGGSSCHQRLLGSDMQFAFSRGADVRYGNWG
jgi:hypothetical protein